MKRILTIFETPVGPVDIFIDENQSAIVFSMLGGWQFAKLDGMQLDFGSVRIEDAKKSSMTEAI